MRGVLTIQVNNMKKIILSFVTLTIIAITGTSFANTSFSYFVNAGTPMTFSNSNGMTKITLDTAYQNAIAFTVIPGELFPEWKVSFGRAANESFHLGTFRNINMSISISGHACKIADNQITIHDFDYDHNGVLQHIAIDFSFSCDNTHTQFASFRYNSDYPNDIIQYAKLKTPSTRVIMYYAPAPSNNSQHIFSNKQNDYTVQLDKSSNYIEVKTDNGIWNFGFAAPEGKKLIVEKFYDNAQYYFFRDRSKPGINVSGDYACQNERGNFKILQLTLDANDQVTQFAADFEVACSGSLIGSHDYGAIRYHSDIPINITAPASYNVVSKMMHIPAIIPGQRAEKKYLKSVDMVLAKENPLSFTITAINPAEPILLNRKFLTPAGGDSMYYSNMIVMIPKLVIGNIAGDGSSYVVYLKKTNSSSWSLNVGDTFVATRFIPLLGQ